MYLLFYAAIFNAIHRGLKMNSSLGLTEEESISRDRRPLLKLSLETGDARLADTFLRSNEAEQEMDKYFVNDIVAIG
jgi:hypothetical protein